MLRGLACCELIPFDNHYYLILSCRNFIAIDDNQPQVRLSNSSQSSGVECSSDNFGTNLQLFASKLIRCDSEAEFRMTIRRNHALSDALETMELVSAKELFNPLNVVFLGESAVDTGGPTREFLSLIVLQSESSHFMESK